MQITAGRKYVHRPNMRVGIIIIAVLGLLATASILTFERADDSPAIVAPVSNTLPDVVVDRPMSAEQMRFIEVNTQLPETTARIPATDRQQSIERIRLLEMNMLPGDEAPTDRRQSMEQMRLIEMNMLPGDDAPQIAPASDSLGEPF